jgi:glutamine---fructose-6-phosphate transaminase (isomerizing)
MREEEYVCSIIGFVSSNRASPSIVQGLRRMEYRGYDSAGVAALEGNKIRIRKGVGKVEEVNDTLGMDELPGYVAVGHTRWATHGGVTERNAHPHLSNSGKLAIVHNGIVDNYQVLKESLQRDGFTFKSETDTEVIANLLDKALAETGSIEKAIVTAVNQIEGKYAFVAIFEDGRLAATRFHEPLIIAVGKDGYFVASDVLGFAGTTDKVLYLDNGEFALMDHEGISIFDFRGNPVPHSITRVMEDFGVIGKGKYVHFTIKEIFEQPQTVAKAGTDLTEAELTEVSRLLTGAKRVYVTGCGTSYHAALFGSRLLSAQTQVNATPLLASEAKFSPVKYDSDTLMIAISQSGETADLLETVEMALGNGAKVLSIVNVTTSTLARLSTLSLGLRCGPEIGVAATKSFTSELATLYTIAGNLSTGSTPSGLQEVSKGISEILEKETDIREIAKRIKDASDIYILGTGAHYSIALEGALKIKELAYIHAEALPGGELKHGPLAMLGPGVYVIAINPTDSTYVDMLASTHEVKARGARIIGVSDQPSPDMYDEWVWLPKVDPPSYPLVEVVPFQLLAYYLAVERNADPDYPRNLAKSVTVK